MWFSDIHYKGIKVVISIYISHYDPSTGARGIQVLTTVDEMARSIIYPYFVRMIAIVSTVCNECIQITISIYIT